MKRIRKNIIPIYGGVRVGDATHIQFNWSKDDADRDIISLVGNPSGRYDDDGIHYVYGYSYTANASQAAKRDFRNYIKGKTNPKYLYTADVQKFVETGLLNFDQYYPMSRFEVTIHIDSTRHPSLVDVMSEYICEYTRNKHIDFALVKETYNNVQFNVETAQQAFYELGFSKRATENRINQLLVKFDELKKSGALFEMKSFLPREIRSAFTHFLKFHDDAERRTYESLQGVNVLIFDDFLTSGATIKEAIRYLRSIHNKNNLTAFVLVKQ